jgi:hypothetical protein
MKKRQGGEFSYIFTGDELSESGGKQGNRSCAEEELMQEEGSESTQSGQRS